MSNGSPDSTSAALKMARTCYGHPAGAFGCALSEALQAGGFIVRDGQQFRVAASGAVLFAELGIDLEKLGQTRSAFAPACLDGSERKPHLGGALGRALTAAFIARGWITRRPTDRALSITESGRLAFLGKFGLTSAWRD